MSFLAQYTDPALAIPQGLTVEILEGEEIDRLRRQIAVVSAVMVWPRRLGGDATDAELALDKKYARRVNHVLQQSIASWTGGRPGPMPDGDEIRQEAAILNWVDWFEWQNVYLAQRIAFISTWATQDGGDLMWSKKAVVKLSNEQNWTQYARR